MTVGTGEWIRRFHPAPQAAAQLVCLAHAGGAASYFFPVSKALSPAVDVLAVQYPGRQERRRETPFENAELLADAVAEQLADVTGRPLALFGHSLGATVAFEVARRLEAAGITRGRCSSRAGRHPRATARSGCTWATTSNCSRRSSRWRAPTRRC
ncbi:hypothetical protein GCM10020295_07820 [Streptomyces cinereospinus]